MQIINSILSKSSLVKNLQKQVKALTTLSTGVTIGNYRAIYPDWQIFKEAEAYQKFDDIYSVVSFLAETAATIPLYAYSVKNDSALKHYQQKGATTLQGRYYQTKALVDLPESDLLARFLSSFTYEQRLFHSLYEFTRGETIYYLYQEDIGPNAGEIRPYMLNKDYVTLFVSEEFPQRILKYRYDDGKNQFDIAPEDIMHTKFPNPDFNNGNNWRGLSPMKVLNKRIARIESGMNASVAQLQNGGVPGVMFMKGDGDIELMGKLQDDLAKFLSNSDNKGAPYYASGDIGYIPWGLPLADLEVAELAGIDFTKICNAFKVPEQLLNNHRASTDNNMQWAEKRLYTNSVLPSIYRLRDAINQSVLPKFTDGKKRFVECDISGVSALQDDLQKQAQALNSMWWISPNEKREIQQFDVSEEPVMNEIIIPSGMMLLSDLTIQDVNLDNGQNQSADSGQSV